MARTAPAPSALLLTLILALAGGRAVLAAGPSGAGAGAPLAIQPGQVFALRPGEVAVAADAGGLRIGFLGVSADARCPKGEQCVWAGDATVQVWLQAGARPRQVAELHTAPGRTSRVAVAGHALRLQGLEPWPVRGRSIAAADYMAHLLLESGSSGDER